VSLSGFVLDPLVFIVRLVALNPLANTSSPTTAS
jgi:hypothetical protein